MMMRKVALWIGVAVAIGWSSGASALPANNPITAGLIAAYEFSGNADDVSGNGNDGVVNGATLTADRFGNVGSAYSFDEVGDYIQAAGSLGGLSEYTQSAWVNLNANEDETAEDAIVATPNGVIFYLPSSRTLNIVLIEDRQGGATSNPHTSFNYYVPLGISDETWFHIAVTAHADNTADLFINGNSVALGTRFTDGGGVGDIGGTAIGALETSNQSPPFQYLFSGSIDDVYIYNRALSPSEVSTLFSVVPEPNTALLLGVGLSALAATSRRRSQSS